MQKAQTLLLGAVPSPQHEHHVRGRLGDIGKRLVHIAIRLRYEACVRLQDILLRLLVVVEDLVGDDLESILLHQRLTRATVVLELGRCGRGGEDGIAALLVLVEFVQPLGIVREQDQVCPIDVLLPVLVLDLGHQAIPDLAPDLDALVVVAGDRGHAHLDVVTMRHAPQREVEEASLVVEQEYVHAVTGFLNLTPRGMVSHWNG